MVHLCLVLPGDMGTLLESYLDYLEDGVEYLGLVRADPYPIYSAHFSPVDSFQSYPY